LGVIKKGQTGSPEALFLADEREIEHRERPSSSGHHPLMPRIGNG